MNEITYFGIFVSSFFMGFSHCLGMCGGIVLLQAQKSLLSHIIYNLGRISTYLILGLLINLFARNFSISPKSSAYALIFLGVFLCLFSFCYAFFPRLIAAIEPNIAGLKIYRYTLSFVLQSKQKYASFILGLLNGLLPCGMIYYFIGLSLSADHLAQSLLMILCFGIGTAFPLLFLALGTALIPRRLFFWLGIIGMLSLGILNIYKGVSKLQHPYAHQTEHAGHMQPMQSMHHQSHHSMQEEE